MVAVEKAIESNPRSNGVETLLASELVTTLESPGRRAGRWLQELACDQGALIRASSLCSLVQEKVLDAVRRHSRCFSTGSSLSSRR